MTSKIVWLHVSLLLGLRLGLVLGTVKPPLAATSLQWPLFLADSPYIDCCLNLSTTATFFCPQGGCCGEVQLKHVKKTLGSAHASYKG